MRTGSPSVHGATVTCTPAEPDRRGEIRTRDPWRPRRNGPGRTALLVLNSCGIFVLPPSSPHSPGVSNPHRTLSGPVRRYGKCCTPRCMCCCTRSSRPSAPPSSRRRLRWRCQPETVEGAGFDAAFVTAQLLTCVIFSRHWSRRHEPAEPRPILHASLRSRSRSSWGRRAPSSSQTPGARRGSEPRSRPMLDRSGR